MVFGHLAAHKREVARVQNFRSDKTTGVCVCVSNSVPKSDHFQEKQGAEGSQLWPLPTHDLDAAA